jgi:hypothetical protein
MPPSIDAIRLKLRQQNSKNSGDDGEMYARKWMQSAGWIHVDIDQDKRTLGEALKAAGGKRPDFLVECIDGTVIALDAKHMKVGHFPCFKMTLLEIQKYINLSEFVEREYGCKLEIIFMLIPKEYNGKKITFIDINEFSDSTECLITDKQARSIDISARLNDPQLTFDIP